MPFVPSTGTISFNNDIEDVFEDQSPPTMKLSEYYRNGTNVQTAVTASNVDTNTVVTSGIPTSGTISFSDFRNQGYSFVVQSVIFDRNNTTTGQDFTWTVPTGITEVSAFLVGAGGGGGGNDGTGGASGAGGGGGGTVWGHWSVTAGTTYTLRIGSGGASGDGNTGADGGDGGDTYIKSGSTIIMQANGGIGGQTTAGTGTGSLLVGSGGNGGGGTVGSGVTGQAQTGGDGGDGGGNLGGGGGGGAAGYGALSSGKGGDGENAQGSIQPRENGIGGSAAGGDRTNSGFPSAFGSGGAVGLFGQVKSGTISSATTNAGVSNSVHGSTYDASLGVSVVPSSGPGSITLPTNGTFNNPTTAGSAGSPGGGGAGIEDDTLGFGHKGGDGAIRIVWGTASNGNARRYPVHSNVKEA